MQLNPECSWIENWRGRAIRPPARAQARRPGAPGRPRAAEPEPRSLRGASGRQLWTEETSKVTARDYTSHPTSVRHEAVIPRQIPGAMLQEAARWRKRRCHSWPLGRCWRAVLGRQAGRDKRRVNPRDLGSLRGCGHHNRGRAGSSIPAAKGQRHNRPHARGRHQPARGRAGASECV